LNAAVFQVGRDKIVRKVIVRILSLKSTSRSVTRSMLPAVSAPRRREGGDPDGN
jgi:hypothetical protein